MLKLLNYFTEDIIPCNENTQYIRLQMDLYKKYWLKYQNDTSHTFRYNGYCIDNIRYDKRPFPLPLHKDKYIDICWDVDGLYALANQKYKPTYATLEYFQKCIIPEELVYIASDDLNMLRAQIQKPIAHDYGPILLMSSIPYHMNIFLDGRHRYVEYEQFYSHKQIPYFILDDSFCIDYIIHTNSQIAYIILYNVGLVLDWVRSGMSRNESSLHLLDIQECTGL